MMIQIDLHEDIFKNLEFMKPLKPLGTGTNGTVYKVKKWDMDLALKVSCYRDDWIDSQSESHLQGLQLNHPNILRFLAFQSTKYSDLPKHVQKDLVNKFKTEEFKHIHVLLMPLCTG